MENNDQEKTAAAEIPKKQSMNINLQLISKSDIIHAGNFDSGYFIGFSKENHDPEKPIPAFLIKDPIVAKSLSIRLMQIATILEKDHAGKIQVVTEIQAGKIINP